MRRIDDRTVELTRAERNASAGFERRLDYGDSIPRAVAMIRKAYGSSLSEDFYAWLAE